MPRELGRRTPRRHTCARVWRPRRRDAARTACAGRRRAAGRPRADLVRRRRRRLRPWRRRARARVIRGFERRLRGDPGAWRGGARHADTLRPWIAADGNSPTAPPPRGGRRCFAVMTTGNPGRESRVGQHRRPHPEHRLAGPPRPPPLCASPRRAGAGRAAGRAGRANPARSYGATTSRPTSRPPPCTATPRCTSRSPMTPGRCASAGTCTPSSGCATDSRWTTTCARSSSRSTATRKLLTPAAVDYLKRYGPVGCRDWTTVHLLLSLDVPAFFSGCVTTTIHTVFPDGRRPPTDAPVAYVDVPDAEGGATTATARSRSAGARSSPTSGPHSTRWRRIARATGRW